MIIPIKKIVETEAKYVRFHAKLRDEGSYELLDEKKKPLAEHEGYVPKFFPYGLDGTENHFGDYIDLVIDIDEGIIINWHKPSPNDIMATFFADDVGDEK